MPRLRLGRPIWLDRRRTPRAPRFPQCRGSHTVDVVVIGGGITGAVAAYTFADAGHAVALLEARRVGRGSTAASTALLMQEPDKDFRELARRYGVGASRRVWEAIAGANKDLASLINRLGISCEFAESESIYYTRDASRVAELQLELAAGRFRLIHTYVIGTFPIGSRASARLAARNVMLWDTGRPYHYLRWTPDGCLLFGGADRALTSSSGRRVSVAYLAASMLLRQYSGERAADDELFAFGRTRRARRPS